MTTRCQSGLLVALLLSSACHLAKDPTFDADEYLATAWTAALAAGEQRNDPTLQVTAEWRPGDCDSTRISTRLPRCLIRSILNRAIADGAPRDAEATLEFFPSDQPGAQMWNFETREPAFARIYSDDCRGAVLGG